MPRYTLATKDPDEVLDYQHDLTPRLIEADTVAGTPTLTVEEGTVVVDEIAETDGVVTFWLSGGTDGEKCHLVMQAITAGGRTYEEGFSLRIKAK